MGNYKFRFSDMIPNAWFYKLKNMNNNTKTLNHSKQKHSPEFTNSNQRKSYYFTRDLTLVQPISPYKPATAAHPSCRCLQPTPPRQFSTSIPAGCSCVATAADNSSERTNFGTDQSSLSKPDSVLTEYGSDRGLDPLLCNLTQPGTTGAAMQNCTGEDPHRSDRETGKCGPANDIVTDTGKSNDQCRRLPPIITRKTEPSASPVRRLPSGIKLRANSSPRLAVHGRRRSMAVVKASKDPRRDFRESMVEMISQYNIRESNDLEELLACYLLLNSDDHHHLIINAFKQIWFDFIHLRLQ